MLSPFSMGFSIGVLCVFGFVCSVICSRLSVWASAFGYYVCLVWLSRQSRTEARRVLVALVGRVGAAVRSRRGAASNADSCLLLRHVLSPVHRRNRCAVSARDAMGFSIGYYVCPIAVPCRPEMLWASALGTMCVWFASKASVRLDETIHDASPSPSSKASRKRPLSPPASPPTQEPAAASAASRSVGFIILCLISREVRRLAASRYGTSFSCITYADQRSYVSHLNRGETISVLPSITAYCVTSSAWTPLDLSTNGTWL